MDIQLIGFGAIAQLHFSMKSNFTIEIAPPGTQDYSLFSTSFDDYPGRARTRYDHVKLIKFSNGHQILRMGYSQKLNILVVEDTSHG